MPMPESAAETVAAITTAVLLSIADRARKRIRRCYVRNTYQDDAYASMLEKFAKMCEDLADEAP